MRTGAPVEVFGENGHTGHVLSLSSPRTPLVPRAQRGRQSFTSKKQGHENSGGLKSTRHLGPERAVGKGERTWGRILQLCIY